MSKKEAIIMAVWFSLVLAGLAIAFFYVRRKAIESLGVLSVNETNSGATLK
jgi:hypothetical protein